MLGLGVEPNGFTLSSVIKACSELGDTSVISAFTKNDLFQEALVFFISMLRKNKMSPDSFTFGTILTACANLGKLKQGKSGSLNESHQVFDQMTKLNSVTWCALLNGYCQKGHFDTVINLFRQIKQIDLYSFGTLIRACAGLAAVRQGKEIHYQYLRKHGSR
ncbi:hypothetical protein L2E82_41643 [Cichorium intybus]|uniref:Uncharacterized protein n=1 Tax=Cichorium intybus TaxID=13427 RepID=A0ACB8ZKQ3_CICIN|nr:hypothetical protein L2E82_41643 [Cichorium intybus]